MDKAIFDADSVGVVPRYPHKVGTRVRIPYPQFPKKRKKENDKMENTNFNKETITGLLFYFKNSAELDPGIQEQTIDVLTAALNKINDEEAAAAKKRKSPNKSGVLQIDPETNKIIAEFETQKAALEAIGKEGKSGVGDALNKRTKTRVAYGYKWVFKDEYDEFLKEMKNK